MGFSRSVGFSREDVLAIDRVIFSVGFSRSREVVPLPAALLLFRLPIVRAPVRSLLGDSRERLSSPHPLFERGVEVMVPFWRGFGSRGV